MIRERKLTLVATQTLFQGPQLRMVLAAIDASNTAGRLWRTEGEAQPSDKALAFLWDQGNNVFYLAGSPREPRSKTALVELVTNEIRAAAVADGARYFRARGLTPDLHKMIPGLFPRVELKKTDKRFYRYPEVAAPVVPAPPRVGVTIMPIDASFLQRTWRNASAVRNEIAWMWPSIERYLANGLGMAAIVDQEIVCWCTGEYVSGTMCGIGIETLPAFQRQGIATAVAADFIREALRRGMQPHWECDGGNLPSVRVAEKLGFSLLTEDDFWAGRF